MTGRALRLIDGTCHVLHSPLMFGRHSARSRWWHRMHLIPGSWLSWVCDRYDATLGGGPG